MSAQRLRWLLRSAAVLLLLASVAAVVWAVNSPQTSDDANSAFAPTKRASAARTKLIHSPSLAEFAKVWSKQLRRPLYDPPPVSGPPKRNKSRNPQKHRPNDRQVAVGGVKLVGTMMEDGRSKAIFMNSNGAIDVKGDGETLAIAAGIRVDRIELQRVTISNDGRLTTLQLPQTKTP